jgi:hypothetical protein
VDRLACLEVGDGDGEVPADALRVRADLLLEPLAQAIERRGDARKDEGVGVGGEYL